MMGLSEKFGRLSNWVDELFHGKSEPPPQRRDALDDRRRLLAEAGVGPDKEIVPPGAMGIAFSGGGIRSATISLGVAQALAQKDRLLDFDYCSTVSGGGYFGSFLTSLFLPDWARGPDARTRPKDEAEQLDALKKKQEFAFQALNAKARSMDLPDPDDPVTKKIRNPIWWLREHSRYLSPNGTSDYLIAAVYMVRNWLAMIYVMSLPIALGALLILAFDIWLQSPGSATGALAGLQPWTQWPSSPAWLAALLLAFLGLASAAAYWLTEFMTARGHKAARPDEKRGWFRRFFDWLRSPRMTIGLSAVAGIGLSWGIWKAFGLAVGSAQAILHFAFSARLEKVIGFGCTLLAISSAIGLICVLRAGPDYSGNALTAEVRRRLTKWNARIVALFFIVATLALVDTLGKLAYAALLSETHRLSWSAIGPALFGAIAWFINKAKDWFGEKDSLVKRIVGRSVWTIALIAGAAMFLTLAVGLHMGIQSLILDGKWTDGPPAFGDIGNRLIFIGAILLGLTLVTGTSTGFINLSSLHGIYASRLTRAYLGASNMLRLKKKPGPEESTKSTIKETDPHDQIPVDIYQQTAHLGPLHLINVTLNETRSPNNSQLLERDRKGVPVVFAPEGVLINAACEPGASEEEAAHSWAALAEADVEDLSVGQLCAISGAAASSAMGSKTTLGGALALTFANIRLGYWWDTKDKFRTAPTLRSDPIFWLYQKITRPFRTYFYLWNELTANYTRENARLNLSDGGHFDNSGAYELLRRGVKAIVVCDNGADAGFQFGDLEVLIRKARIDLGLAIEVAPVPIVRALMTPAALPLFLNGSDRDWRRRAAARDHRSGSSKPDDRAFCLLLEAFDSPEADEPVSTILWLKPRLFAGLPQDVIGYGIEHGDFPHETTGDQFFNEAQWESYRSLGFTMMGTILGQPYGSVDRLRDLMGIKVDATAGPSPAKDSAKPKSGPARPAAKRPPRRKRPA